MEYLEFIKLAGLSLLPLSLYLAIKKIGTAVSFNFTYSVSNIGERISSIVIINNKDKPVVIGAITARCEGIEFNLNNFEEPLILKAYEAIRVVAEPYSFLSLNGKPWTIPYKVVENNVELLLELADGSRHKCKPLFKSHRIFANLFRKKFRPAPTASKHKVHQNGIIYNPDTVRFVVLYVHNSQQMTTFVENSGFISESTGLGINMLREEQMASPVIVEETLKRLTPGLVVKVFCPNT